MWQPEQPSSQTVARMAWSLLPQILAEPLEERKEGSPFLGALGDRTAVLEQRARGADLDALAAARAGRRVAPAVPIRSRHAPRCREPMTPQVWAPSISSHTRTQRTHTMQRLWSMHEER